MASLILTKGYVAEVDDDLSERLSQWKWSTRVPDQDRVYAFRSIHGGRKHIHLHRQIMELALGRSLQPGEEVDHRDGNTLNNRRENLRVATRQQQLWNATKRNSRGRRATRSPYKGVVFRRPGRLGDPPRRKPWNAMIRLNGKAVSLGYYATDAEAALAYNRAAAQHFGEFARLNDVE